MLLYSETRFKHLIDKTVECVIDIGASLCASLKSMHMILLTELLQLITRYLTLLNFITLITHDDHWPVTDLSKLLDPLFNAKQPLSVS